MRFDQSSLVQPVSESRGGSTSVTEQDERTKEILVSNIGFISKHKYCPWCACQPAALCADQSAVMCAEQSVALSEDQSAGLFADQSAVLVCRPISSQPASLELQGVPPVAVEALLDVFVCLEKTNYLT